MDSLLLYGPGGASPVQLGSYLRQDVGVDYGAKGLLQAVEIEGFGDGGRFAYQRAGIRKMAIPLLVASGAAGVSLTQFESLIRDAARPGGYLDVQPEGTPTGEAVRFDLIHGRYEPDYSIYHQRAWRRAGNLFLDTQPYGYWPTVILLASGVSASYQDTFSLSWNPASIIGDAPALAVLGLQASVATSITMTTNAVAPQYTIDGLWWSLALPSGATSFMVPSDFHAATLINTDAAGGGTTNISLATHTTINTAPYGNVLRLDLVPTSADAWKQVLTRQLGGSVGQLYAGRYRVYGSFRFTIPNATAQSTFCAQILMDEAVGSYETGVAPMASAYPIGTLIPIVPASFSGANQYWPDAFRAGVQATEPGFQLVDLGEHSFPPAPSGAWSTPWSMRFWVALPSSAVPTSPRLEFAGIRLQSLDGPAGILPYGMIVPSTNNIVGTDASGNFWGVIQRGDSVAVDAVNQRVGIWIGSYLGVGSNLASPLEFLADKLSVHRGAWPQLVGTENQLTIGLLDRRAALAGATAMIANTTRAKVAASVSYRPQFQFLKGL